MNISENKEADKKRKDIINRLKTVRGHIAGIEKMLEEGQSCDKVLTQILAARSALHKAGLLVMGNSAHDCLFQVDENGRIDTERAEEVIRMILNFAK
jgi:DNA-binding FrmR family transcriptional regulator